MTEAFIVLDKCHSRLPPVLGPDDVSTLSSPGGKAVPSEGRDIDEAARRRGLVLEKIPRRRPKKGLGVA